MPSVKHYSSSEVDQYELSSRLLSLTENNTSYTLTQINGQRIYRKAPHAWSGPEPSRNCEVFIGRIPHDCFEDTLVPLFRQAGELFEFRLMINFSGWNRGYAFAMYTTEAEAGNAIRLFNNYMIRPSWQLGVCPSINNCRIFISRIPPTTPSAEIVRLLYALTEEVQEVRIRRGAASCAAIVEYKSHRGAAMARKALVAAAAAAWGTGARPAVDWSMPQSPQLLRQYREVGRWSPEGGVELNRVEEPEYDLGGAGLASLGTGAGRGASYSLERWSQARRLRMIHEAQRNASRINVPPRPASAQDWGSQLYGMESPLSSMMTLNMPSVPNVWTAPAPSAPRVPDFNPWTTRHPLGEFMTPTRQQYYCTCPLLYLVLCNSHGVAGMALCDKWVALKIVEFLFCVACLVAKRVSTDDEARLALLLQKLSREWSLLTSVTWDSVGGSFADAVYGGYVIITFALILGRVFYEVPIGRRILEGILLGFGSLFFLVLGGLELASLDSVPYKLIVNASILGSLSLFVAILFLIDLMGPRVYTSTRPSQTDPISSPKLGKKVSIVTQPAINGQNGHIPNGKQNGHVPERPKDLDLEHNKDKVNKKDEPNLFNEPKFELMKLDKLGDLPIEKDLEKSKFGSLRNGVDESGNYVRLTEPLTIPDRLHYEQELAKFNEKYLRDYLENVSRLPVREDYLPELQTPVFSKVKTGRLKGLYDDVSPTYERKRQSKSPTRAKTVPTPTIQQLEDYLRSSNRSRRSETPALFPMEPIEERDRELADNDGRASGTPTDPGYVQYTAKKWPDKTREIRTPRHSPT